MAQLPTLLHPIVPPSSSPQPLCVERYPLPLKKVPADFFADPDGDWDWDMLVREAGFEGESDIAIGALAEDFRGHPAGAAVVTLNRRSRPYVAIIECPPLPGTGVVGGDVVHERVA
jgi:hypothetical protein